MSDQLLVATRKGLMIYERDGRGWRLATSAFLGDRVSAVCRAGDGALLAALDHGHFGRKLQRSEDQGRAWSEVPAPSYPEKPAGLVDTNPNSQKETPWSVELLWALEPGNAGSSRLWCGTIPGGLFRSDDNGASWQLVESLWLHPSRSSWFGGGYDWPGIHSICVDPRDEDRVTVGVSCGGVWTTDDGGASWEARTKGMIARFMPPEQQEEPAVQDPHRVVACAAAPDVLWTQHHSGVFRSTDGGARWTELEVPPSSFGFAVAVHPDDPETAWFVPAIADERRIPVDGAVVVTRTRDGGRSFEALRDGLPQRGAFDLVYRHALAVDDRGQRLAMGSTTGNLWTSDDGGDHWTCVSTHLPPIHAVRFV
ncbi:MAG: sialidase family protein [Nannocystaceae bacterium]|nr:exo-alpha-sialidase [Myxococcales bacterium]